MLKKLFVSIFIPAIFFVSHLNSMQNIKQQGKLDKEKAEEHIVPEQSFQIGAQLKDIDKAKEKPDDGKVIFTFGNGKNKIGFSLKNRTEAFYSKGVQLLSPSPLDQVVFTQTTWDLRTDASIGDAIKSLLVIRHKGRWGNPNTIARTTTETIKIADAVTGAHNHFVGKQILWVREGWVDILLNEVFCLNNLKHKHYLTFGEFSFRLGRGIALGDAYAVSPGLLGFYSNNVIDQYAPGLLLHGNLRENIKYDVYLGILENLSDSFDNVNEQIYAMQIGKRKCPQRGFGKLNYVFASRLFFYLLTKERDCRSLIFEPYILYNNTPEQDVDFPSDANSKLVTVGAAFEYEGERWEWGGEFAQNFGRQRVKPWDRNLIQIKRDGKTADLKLFYSEVLTKNPETGKMEPAPVTNKNKEIVNNSIQSPLLNGKEIGNTGLFNDINRFRAGYENIYNGFMFVTDASCKVSDTFKVKGTFGLASGDLDPNVDIDDPNDADVDGVYSGFIGLQELYSGKRVPSIFIVGPNQIARPLSVPSNQIPEEDLFAQNVKNFTNLMYFGVGFDWAPSFCKKQVNIKPNLLMYWHEHATKKFSLKKKETINELASKYLGLEINLFVDIQLLKNLKGFFVGGVFQPGQYFKDVRGTPLSKAQREALKEVNDTGYNKSRTLFLNDSTALSLNWGFEYIF